MVPGSEVVRGGRPAVFDRLNRIVVQVATLTAIVFLAVLLLSWAATGKEEFAWRALSPLAVSSTGLVMLWMGRPSAVLHLGIGMAGLAAHVALLDPDNNDTVVIGLVAMALAGVLFLRSRRIAYTVVMSIAVFAAGVAWSPESVPEDERAAVAIGPVILFVFLAWLIVWLQDQLVAGQEEYRLLFTRYRQLFDSAPIALWEVDFAYAADWLREVPDDLGDLDDYFDEHPDVLDHLVRKVRVVAVNKATLDLLGVASLPEVRRHMIEHNLDTTKATMRAQLVATWRGEHGTTVEHPMVAVDGSEIDTVIKTAIDISASGSRLQVIASSIDVTEQKQHEARLGELIKSKDDFVATVSHELRTPLTAVVGLASELRDRLGEFDPAEVRDFAGIIAGQSQEVADIVEDLLVAARADLGGLVLQKQPVDLTAETRSVATTMVPDADVSTGTGRPVLALADTGRVRQIIRNLIVNAQRYGGPTVRTLCRTSDDRAFVEVRDNGSEVPDEDRGRMFDAYHRLQTTHGLTASVGLGLTVSRSLARMMGGDLTYHHDGTESVFTLSLPLASAAITTEHQPA